MKRLLLILILTLSFQSWTKADDIRDFQIEGMSIGDSLLDYYSRNEILNALKKQPKKGYIFPVKKYRSVRFLDSGNFSDYEKVLIAFRDKDNKFIIEHIMGVIEYSTNFSKCFTVLNSVENSIDNFQDNFSKNKKTYIHPADKSGKSKLTQVGYIFSNDALILASCADWSKKMNITDALRVEIQSKKFRIFVEEVYK